jgi:hypothetical protein
MEYRKQLEDQIDMNKERVVFKIEMPEIDIIKEKVKRDE